MARPQLSFIQKLTKTQRKGPSYPILPEVDEQSETNIDGVYAIGEIAGTPLVKLGLNAGHDLISRIGPDLKSSRGSTSDDVYDLLIVGSGSSGLAASVRAQDLGLKYITIEAAAFANTFVTMMKGKLLLAEPDSLEKTSRVWFEECKKEDLLQHWRAIRDDEGLNIREQERVVDVQGQKGNFVTKTNETEYKSRIVVLCMGKAGNPRKLNVPGEKEFADRIHHKLLDPDDFSNQNIIVIGGGDVACEAVIALAETNNVTMSAINDEFIYPKKRNIDKVRALEADGKLKIILSSAVTEFTKEHAKVLIGGEEEVEVQYDTAFEMIGAELPIPFFNKVGIELANTWNWQRWVFMIMSFIFVYSLYALKSFGKEWVQFPFNYLITPEQYKAGITSIFSVAYMPFSWMFSDAAMANILADKGFQQGYLYSGLYTLIMIVFGYQALIRWRSQASNKRYQTYRYISLISFQVGFFLLVNVIGIQAMDIKYAWRFYGLYQPFPLFFNTFFWWYPSDPRWLFKFFVGAGLLGSLVGIPLLSLWHGKRFCTWICGCGGLAETLGDRWRHLSAKGPRSQSWEFQGVLIFFASVIVGLIVVGWYNMDGSNWWWKSYNYIVDFWLVAVIPIALYPFFGGKVWCRYWCPLAAYNGLLAKWYGRLKIVSNDHCIQCTQCSKYCQVGIDVMAFAKNMQPFDNSNSVCIHCGICIDVCPMDVLSFETSKPNSVTLIKLNKSTGLPT